MILAHNHIPFAHPFDLDTVRLLLTFGVYYCIPGNPVEALTHLNN